MKKKYQVYVVSYSHCLHAGKKEGSVTHYREDDKHPSDEDIEAIELYLSRKVMSKVRVTSVNRLADADEVVS